MFAISISVLGVFTTALVVRVILSVLSGIVISKMAVVIIYTLTGGAAEFFPTFFR